MVAHFLGMPFPLGYKLEVCTLKFCWYERSAFQSVGVGGNDVSVLYKRHYFAQFLISVATFSHRKSARIEKLFNGC